MLATISEWRDRLHSQGQWALCEKPCRKRPNSQKLFLLITYLEAYTILSCYGEEKQKRKKTIMSGHERFLLVLSESVHFLAQGAGRYTTPTKWQTKAHSSKTNSSSGVA